VIVGIHRGIAHHLIAVPAFYGGGAMLDHVSPRGYVLQQQPVSHIAVPAVAELIIR
jgi:hypothetical protein